MLTNKIYQGHSLEVLKTFPDESIDMCVTSPPYWGLRDYGTNPQVWDNEFYEGECEHDWGENLLHPSRGNRGEVVETKHEVVGIKQPHITNSQNCKTCGAWKGELGLEPDFNLYVKHLCDIFDEVKRVLKKSGSCWVNIGDTYYTKSGSAFSGDRLAKKTYIKSTGISKANKVRGLGLLPTKTLTQIPSRFAIETINRGWTLRNEIIWHKPSCMPSSAVDRFTVDFEKLFFFTKSRKYYFKQQLEPLKPLNRWGGPVIKRPLNTKVDVDNSPYAVSYRTRNMQPKQEGRNKRTVWSINTKGFSEAHFATFPPELIETPIDAGCPETVCSKCGNPKELKIENKTDSSERRKIAKKKLNEDIKQGKVKVIAPQFRPNNPASAYEDLLREYCQREGMSKGEKIIKGYEPTCSCDVEFTSGIVLDPFFGSGTTAEVAMEQDKKWVGIELNQEYIDIAEKRLKSPTRKYKTRKKSEKFWG